MAPYATCHREGVSPWRSTGSREANRIVQKYPLHAVDCRVIHFVLSPQWQNAIVPFKRFECIQGIFIWMGEAYGFEDGCSTRVAWRWLQGNPIPFCHLDIRSIGNFRGQGPRLGEDPKWARRFSKRSFAYGFWVNHADRTLQYPVRIVRRKE